MLDRPLRLRRDADFARVRSLGKQWRHPLLTLAFAPNALDHNRYGFVTTRRLGNAVTRNRAKRLMREVIRLAHSRLQTGLDIVLIARQELIEQPFQIIQAAIHSLLSRAHLWVEGIEPK